MSNFLKANSIKCHTEITEITDFLDNIEKHEKTETPFRDSRSCRATTPSVIICL